MEPGEKNANALVMLNQQFENQATIEANKITIVWRQNCDIFFF